MRTRDKILDIVRKRSAVRPAELRKLLGLSGPAIHRQLRSLVEDGLLERRGAPPFSQYAMAGIPNLTDAFAWLAAGQLLASPPTVCESRDALAARLPRLKNFIHDGLSVQDLPLVIATVGEIANNCFDHNLGLWRDVSGCWLESQVSGGRLWTCVADRGQGILRSLANVVPGLTDDQAALDIAFSQQVTGRAPEQRGNGLKFVKANIVGAAGRGVACGSGSGVISFGDMGARAEAVLRENVSNVQGTVTLMVWELA